MAVVRIDRFQAKEGLALELRSMLSSTLDRIHRSPGCRTVELLGNPEDPLEFAIMATWDSIEAHDAAARRIEPELLEKAHEVLASPPTGSYHQRP
jgi:heme-degrading monooxygenase HmoA